MCSLIAPSTAGRRSVASTPLDCLLASIRAQVASVQLEVTARYAKIVRGVTSDSARVVRVNARRGERRTHTARSLFRAPRIIGCRFVLCESRS